jgi:hypothetical protein
LRRFANEYRAKDLEAKVSDLEKAKTSSTEGELLASTLSNPFLLAMMGGTLS